MSRKLVRRQKPVPLVRTVRHPSKDVLRAENRQRIGLQRSAQRRGDQNPAGFEHTRCGFQECARVGNVLHDLQANRHIETLPAIRKILDALHSVVDRQPTGCCMRSRHGHAVLSKVDARHLCAKPCKRFADKAAPRPDVEKPDALERLEAGILQPERLGHRVADEPEPCGSELMQGAELAIRIPPARRKRPEAGDFRRVGIDVCGIRGGIRRGLGGHVIWGSLAHAAQMAPGSRRCQAEPIPMSALLRSRSDAAKSAANLRAISEKGSVGSRRPGRWLGLPGVARQTRNEAVFKRSICARRASDGRETMAVVVMKFGGTSVADVDRIRNVARHVNREVKAGNKVAVVVSAMAGTTNQLVAWVNEASRNYDRREYDAVVATGEQITAGLLAIVLQSMGIKARSWQGWQIPIETSTAHGSARIKNIDGKALREHIEGGEVAVITGFQGVEPHADRVATLGRGGSDTSAVAIAVAVDADVCDIYTDVDGVYTTDPRIVQKARRLPKISYEEMLEMASLGSKVLQTRSVELAMVHRVRVRVLSSFVAPDQMSPVRLDKLEDIGTIVTDEDEIVEQQVVSGIAYAKDEAKVTILSVADKPGVAARIFGPLADANINVDMIVQNVASDGKNTDMTFTVQSAELSRTLDVLKAAEADIGKFEVRSSADVAKISVIGIGMRSHAGVAAEMFKALAEKGINILAISTSEIKISVLIDAAYAELAIRTLHSMYGLDAA